MAKPISLAKRTTLKELVSKEQIFAPCVWDCFSMRAAELAGFKAVLLSSAALAYSMLGMPDTGLLTSDELVFATERMAQSSDLPIIVDGDEGYGDSPLCVFRTCQRLAKAGAMAISIDDTSGIRGYERLFYDNGYKVTLCSKEQFLAKINAAVAGVKGTDCIIIARTGAYRRFGLDEAIDRMVRAEKLGAEMTMVLGIHNLDECKRINEKLPGWKMYPDVESKNGKPDVELDDIAKLGFNLVTMHYLEKGALWGMLDYGLHNFKNKNTVYSDQHDMGGIMKSNETMGATVDYKAFLDLEAKFRDEI